MIDFKSSYFFGFILIKMLKTDVIFIQYSNNLYEFKYYKCYINLFNFN